MMMMMMMKIVTKKTRLSFLDILLVFVYYHTLRLPCQTTLKRSATIFDKLRVLLFHAKFANSFSHQSLPWAIITATLSVLNITESYFMMRMVQIVLVSFGFNIASRGLSCFLSLFWIFLPFFWNTSNSITNTIFRWATFNWKLVNPDSNWTWYIWPVRWFKEWSLEAETQRVVSERKKHEIAGSSPGSGVFRLRHLFWHEKRI